MLINLKNKTIHCFYCNEDKEMKDIYLDVLFERSISCDKDHLIGLQTDEEWERLYLCEFMYSYHKKNQCRCVHEETSCEGQIGECNYPIGREYYLKEREDEELEEEC